MKCKLSRRFKNDLANEVIPTLTVLITIIAPITTVIGALTLIGYGLLGMGVMLDVTANNPFEYYFANGLLHLIIAIITWVVMFLIATVMYYIGKAIWNMKRIFRYIIECEEDAQAVS